MRRHLTGLAAAFALLTRLPIGRWSVANSDYTLTSSTWAYPVVGATVGGLGGLTYWLLHALTFPPTVCAIITIAVIVVTTGALHEDGLADIADGFGGGVTRERKLEIMRDHCVGTYGVVAVFLALAVRAGAITTLREPALVLSSLIAAGAISRTVVVALMWLMPLARSDGLAAGVRRPGKGSLIAAVTLGVLAASMALSATASLVVAAVGALACVGVATLAHRQIGGVTGDVLGAGQQAAECAILAALSAVL